MVAAKGDDADRLQALRIGGCAQHPTRGGKACKRQPDLSPLAGHIKARLIVLPRQKRARCPQMHEVARVIAAHHQSQADRILRRRSVKLHPDLDKAAVVFRAHAAGHHGMPATVFGCKVQLAG